MIDFRAPTLLTDRLRLRLAKPSDLDAYIEFRGSERSRTTGGPYDAPTAFSQLSSIVGHWQIRGFGRFIVADRNSDEPLGVVGPYHPLDWPEPEIAWTVFGNAEGKGIAYEAAQAALGYAYHGLGWTTAMSAINAGNDRSAALAERLGATCESTFEHPTFGPLNIWRHRGPDAYPAPTYGDQDD